jgi:hypothetical protein
VGDVRHMWGVAAPALAAADETKLLQQQAAACQQAFTKWHTQL